MAKLEKNYEMITVVMCVYNAHNETRDALRSIIDHDTDLINRIIVVDDCSNMKTKFMLRQMKKTSNKISIIRNEINLGYTKSANIGLKSSNSKFVALVNSDILVTKGWLESLYRGIESDKTLALCGPLSNCAGWQSVPELFNSDRSWKINIIPIGYTVSTFSELIYKLFEGELVSTPFVNGFCSLIRVEALNQVGYLDEINFPKGYGEENDLAIRFQLKGWNLAIIPEAFVYHEKSRSFGHAQRRKLSHIAMLRLKNKYGDEYIRELTHAKNYRAINSIRERLLCVIQDIK